jgi:hypothetical protein
LRQLLTERYRGRLAGVLSCYDRIIVTATLPGACYAKGMTGFPIPKRSGKSRIVEDPDLSRRKVIIEAHRLGKRVNRSGAAAPAPGAARPRPVMLTAEAAASVIAPWPAPHNGFPEGTLEGPLYCVGILSRIAGSAMPPHDELGPPCDPE